MNYSRGHDEILMTDLLVFCYNPGFQKQVGMGEQHNTQWYGSFHISYSERLTVGTVGQSDRDNTTTELLISGSLQFLSNDQQFTNCGTNAVRGRTLFVRKSII